MIALALAIALSADPSGAASTATKLDLSSFSNSTGPRREAGKRTAGDYGFSEIGMEEGWATFSNPKLGWRLGVKVLQQTGDVRVICFRDEAMSGGSYFTQQPYDLQLDANGLYRAVKAPDRPDC